MSIGARLAIASPWVVAVLLLGVFVAATLAAIEGGALDVETLAFLTVIVLWGVIQSTVGTLIAWRRPENPVGRLLQISGILITSVFLGWALAGTRAMLAGQGDAIGAIGGWWASTMIFLAIYTAFPLVGIVFPDGRLPGPHWRLPVTAITAGLVAICVMYAVAAGPLGPDLPDNPFGWVDVPDDVREAASNAGSVLLVIAMAMAVTAIAVRWRRGTHLERSQLKWLFAALIVAGILFPLTFGGASVEAPTALTLLAVGSAALIPVAIGIAVLRYRLYDIDRIISRTIAYGLITAVLFIVFAGVNLAVQTVLQSVASSSTISVAVSTLVVAALFSPVRVRLQRTVDRRFDRARVDAQLAIDGFAARVREDPDPGTVRDRLLLAATGAVHPRGAAVWIRGEAR
jgi:hypothetical protein